MAGAATNHRRRLGKVRPRERRFWRGQWVGKMNGKIMERLSKFVRKLKFFFFFQQINKFNKITSLRNYWMALLSVKILCPIFMFILYSEHPFLADNLIILKKQFWSVNFPRNSWMTQVRFGICEFPFWTICQICTQKFKKEELHILFDFLTSFLIFQFCDKTFQ